MASLIAKRIDEIVVSGLWPLLKQEGFRRSGRIFRRTVGDAIHVVEVQADKHNEGMHGSFTVNLGLYFKNLERENKRLPSPSAIRQVYGQMAYDHDFYFAKIYKYILEKLR